MMTMTMTMMAATYMIVLTTPTTTIEAFQQNLPSLPRLPRLPDSLPRIPDSLPRPPTQMMPPFLQRQQQQQQEEQEQQKSTASTAPTTSQQMMAVESSNVSSQQQYFYVPSASSLESITTTPSSAIIPSSSGWMPASSNRDSALTRSAIDAAADSYRGTGCLAIAKGGKLLGSSGDINTGGRFTWSVAKSLVGTLVGALDMDVRRPASAYGFRGRRDDMSVASFMAMNTSGSFSYSTGIVGDVASMALDAAGVQKVARTRPPGSLNRVLTEKLYNKIGMRSTRAMDNGGSAITSSCSDLLRLALLWTRRGRWGSTTVFTQEYARLATTSAPSNAGYGLLMYLNSAGVGEPWQHAIQRGTGPLLPNAPADTVLALGIGGQYFLSIPSLDIAISRLATRNCVGCQGLDAARAAWSSLLASGVLGPN